MPTSQRGPLASDTEMRAASSAGLRGALYGACLWGLPSMVVLLVANTFHPVVRGLTLQFKVYLQMSAMMAGSVVEADKRMRDFDNWNRRRKAAETRRRNALVEGGEWPGNNPNSKSSSDGQEIDTD